MKIGFDAKRAFNNKTGLGNYSRFIINSLLKYAPENSYFAYSSKISGVFQGFNAELKDLHFRTPNTKYPMPSIWRSWLIINDLKKDGIKIFHGLSNELPFGMKRSGIKSVVTIHDLIFLRYPSLYPFIDRFFYQIKFRNACQQADAIVAISEQTKQDIIDFYKISADKIHVIYQDCDEIFQQKLKNDVLVAVKKQYNLEKPYLLCVGTIAERKNQLTLVKAFYRLNLTNFQLVLVGGKTAYQNEIQNFIREQNIENVQFLNDINFADLPAIYQGAEVFIYPSLFEGFGIPIVEALHSGVPVIAATGSCLEEAGGKDSIYVNPLDSEGFAEKISLVLKDNILRENMILKGKEYVKRFSAKQTTMDLFNLYQKIHS